jgi:predicted metal-dependent enzyme (double-stranded beta helix superfamily)
LIHWGPGSGVDAHDHDRSAGAFHVVRGALRECEHDEHESDGRPVTVSAGGTRAFEAGYVHSVANASASVTTSVHVYSPPLTAMTYHPGGRVERVE